MGLSPIDSKPRFTFGLYQLNNGFALVVLLIGLFAIAEVMSFAESVRKGQNFTVETDYKIKGAGFSLKEGLAQTKNAIVSALIGVGIGILPGIGGGVSCMISYTVSKNTSKHRELYGTGIMDGVVASETANNATIGGAMIPLLALGIPGDAATAMLLGGLQIHNVAPGPLIYEKNGVVVYAIFFAMVLSAIFMMLFMLLGMRFFVSVLKIPKNFLLPVVVVLCGIGAIGNANMLFDTYCMVAFGLMSYLLIKSKVPTVPMILGFILGPTFETNLRRVSQLASSDPFWNHPIFCVLIIATVFVVIFSTRANLKDAKRAQEAELAEMKAAKQAGIDE